MRALGHCLHPEANRVHRPAHTSRTTKSWKMQHFRICSLLHHDMIDKHDWEVSPCSTHGACSIPLEHFS